MQIVARFKRRGEAMDNQKMLIKFLVKEGSDDIKDFVFAIYGDVEIETGNRLDQKEYQFPEFDGLQMTKFMANGEEIPFSLNLHTFAGKKVETEDIIGNVLSAAICKNESTYKCEYIHPLLKEMIESFHDEMVSLPGKEIPKRILYKDMYHLYELCLATTKYIYYVYEDLFLAFDTDMNILADNQFAENGYWDSLCNDKIIFE